MPKVRGTMADVSTTYEPIDPDTYEMKVAGVEEKQLSKKPERWMYTVKSQVDMPGTDHHGKPVYTRITIHKKDGDVNEIALAELKRFFEVTVGEDRANADDADTDELLQQRFLGEVIIRHWEDEATGREGDSNEFKAIAPLE